MFGPPVDARVFMSKGRVRGKLDGHHESAYRLPARTSQAFIPTISIRARALSASKCYGGRAAATVIPVSLIGGVSDPPLLFHKTIF